MDTIKKVTEAVRKQTSQKGCYPITEWLVKIIVDEYEKVNPDHVKLKRGG